MLVSAKALGFLAQALGRRVSLKQHASVTHHDQLHVSLLHQYLLLWL
jgi:hypothetical protein